MKFFLFFFLLTSQVWANRTADCDLVSGIYPNSSVALTNLQFETIVDVFTINNAKTLNMTLDYNDLTFTRSNISVTKNIKMIYLLWEKNKAVQAVHIMLDRTPRQINKTKQFNGNMIISQNMEGGVITESDNLVYNFHCKVNP